MKYKVKLFASLKENTGLENWELESESEVKASELSEKFFKEHSELQNLAKGSRIAVNQSFCSEDVLVHENDELALIPPVSGG